MPNNEQDSIESLEIIVRDKALPAPAKGGLNKWIEERLEEDAIDLYSALHKAVKSHLKIRKDPKTKEDILPSIKAMELAADILKMRDGGGININQNFGGNTTIHNNGTTVSFEDLVRRQQAREDKKEETIIEAEIINEESNK